MHRRFGTRDAALKTAFGKIKAEISNLSSHLRYFNAKLTALEKQNKQMAQDIVALKRA